MASYRNLSRHRRARADAYIEFLYGTDYAGERKAQHAILRTGCSSGGRGLFLEARQEPRHAGVWIPLWASQYEQVCCSHLLPSLSRWPLRFGLPAFIKRNRIGEGYLAGRLVPTARTWRFLHGAREGLLQG